MDKINKLETLGQSLWYDNIQRSLLLNGKLEEMINDGRIKGVTSNPSIFQKAIAASKDYDSTLKPMAWTGLTVESIFWQLAIEDIQEAADLFLPVYERTQKKDGYVSLEVNPLYANNTEATVNEAKKLWKMVDRPNLMIKIPATPEGIPAVRRVIAEGINVNVTLIFSVQRYAEVIDAYFSGLEDRVMEGKDISSIASVASFFVSRLDSKIDKRLEELANKGVISAENGKSLSGRAAVANAKMAYELFEGKSTEKRFEMLRAKGAQIQRPLWASTSTKNPNYRDVIYIEELIGLDTVNTVPPATLDAFYEHGTVEATIHKELEAAKKLMSDLEGVGISLDEVTLELENEGVKSFADAFTQLLDAVEKRRKAAIEELGPIADDVRTALHHLQDIRFGERLYHKDATLWTMDNAGQNEISQRMNWLTAPWDSQTLIEDIQTIVKQCKANGFTHAILLGMGGSSLAPEVLSLLHRTDGEDNGYGLQVTILDSTDPEQVMTSEITAPIENTLFIVASKSGTTGEINAFMAYFWDLVQKKLGDNAGEHFIAVTDPGTKLETIARERKFLKVFSADPKVGGRNSALTAFGLVPAGLTGWNLERLLRNARKSAELCQPHKPLESNPGVVLGTIIGAGAIAGRDKLTLITDPTWSPFGAWLEQLIAESSGKNGKGILPVAEEPEMAAECYGNDRLFVYIRENGEKQQFVDELRKNGHPVIHLDVFSAFDLGGEFYIWEVATATACSILGVNSFDQPDVQDAKVRTLKGLEEYKKHGKFDEAHAVIELDKARFTTSEKVSLKSTATVSEVISEFVRQMLKKDDYLAINAFLPRNEQNLKSLQKLRDKLMKDHCAATTLGFGPRYLHSTGQLHKGGKNNGIFLLITSRRMKDVEIPGEGVSFGTLQQAQALGDLQALEAKGRRVLWIDLAEPDPNLLLK